MIYEHKIIDTFSLPCKRPNNMSLLDYGVECLNQASKEGWELVAAATEFKFVLRRPIDQ
jgi:hypothetical protein